MIGRGGRASDLKASLQDVFAQKASATVSGRAGPLARYIKHCISCQEQPFPVVEAGVCAFLQDYAAGEAPRLLGASSAALLLQSTL